MLIVVLMMLFLEIGVLNICEVLYFFCRFLV